MLSKISSFALACIAAIVHADQPVHCMKSHVAGFWTLEVSREAVAPNLANAETVCTHELPNKLQIVSPSLEFTLPGEVSKLFLKLNRDFTVSVLDTAQGQPTGEVGHWTFVYDQSMIVELPQRKAKYVANFRYSLKQGVMPDQYDKLKTGSYEAFDSNCSETMVGVKLGVEDKRVQCWVGYQTEPETRQAATETDLAAPLILAQTSSQQSDAKVLAQTESHTRLGNYLDVSEADRIVLAQTINDAGLTWTADPYIQSKADSLTLAQTSTSTEARGSWNDGSEAFRAALADAQKWLNVPVGQIDIAQLEEQWSWEDVNGYDFTTPPPDQGHCGSCYLLATNQMLESRIKIWFGQDIRLSSQQRLDCNYMNEGCHGGWGHFDGLFLEQYGAVAEQCAQYEAAIDLQGCARWSGCQPIAGAKDTYYVGQRTYGKMSEQDMIKELRSRGPILLDFNADSHFQMYRGGVLSEGKPVSESFQQSNALAQLYNENYCMSHHSSPTCLSKTTSTATQESQNLQWTKLTHSTTVIGYGVDNSKGEPLKYWLVRNSYGPKWGENGNFRIRRGRNDYACESENIAVEPVLF